MAPARPRPIDDKDKYAKDVEGFISKAWHDVPRIPLFQPHLNVATQKNISRLLLLVSPSGRLPLARQGVNDRARPGATLPPCLQHPAPGSGDRDPDADRRGHRDVPADARTCPAIRRSISPGRRPRQSRSRTSANQLGLDQPLTVQFLRYVDDLAHGNLGNSLATGQPVVTEIVSTGCRPRPNSRCSGLIISVLIAVPLGILAAVKQGSWIDHACRVVATAGVSLPVFFTGLLLVYVFYFLLGWAPAPLGRLDVFFTAPPQVTGFYLIDSLIAGDFRDLSRRVEPAHPAGADARRSSRSRRSRG